MAERVADRQLQRQASLGGILRADSDEKLCLSLFKSTLRPRPHMTADGRTDGRADEQPSPMINMATCATIHHARRGGGCVARVYAAVAHSRSAPITAARKSCRTLLMRLNYPILEEDEGAEGRRLRCRSMLGTDGRRGRTASE